MTPPSPSSRHTGANPAAFFLAALLLAALALAGPAAAQDFNPLGWFTDLFKPQQQPGPAMKRAPEIRRAPSSAAPKPKRAARPQEPAHAQKPATPAVEPTYFVAVLGDSLGQMLGHGLTEAFADRPDVAVRRRAKENSGLVRDDFFDWPKTVDEMLASGEKIDIAVIMIGSNDRQTLRDGAGGAFEPLTPEWKAAYAARVERIARAFREKNIPLLWAGLPVMKSERLAADASAFNDLYRVHAEAEGAKFIDLWEAFATESGAFSATGPDVNGEIVRLRAADGIHFTQAGARKLAHFIEPEIRRRLDETTRQKNPESPGVPAPAEARLPGADETPSAGGEPLAAPVEKPIAGPVLPLTGPARAPGGELASRTGGAPRRTPQPGAPQPGRADDFSWPP
ncbi:DUF459 domain-containing protein [Methylocella sp.]|uniref:SGNH/GDSL hydrolase family protein n=1 Tax=Methylocella sp. TaxID=1978226 RepID=UPI00378502ED